jgi:hypothetical protein
VLYHCLRSIMSAGALSSGTMQPQRAAVSFRRVIRFQISMIALT